MARPGRPRVGDRASRLYADEKVSQFVKLTGRYPVPLAARLRSLAREQGEPLWVLLVEAAEAYFAALPPGVRNRVKRRAKSEEHLLKAGALESYERELERKARQPEGRTRTSRDGPGAAGATPQPAR